jgi:hypothetical protein
MERNVQGTDMAGAATAFWAVEPLRFRARSLTLDLASAIDVLALVEAERVKGMVGLGLRSVEMNDIMA